MKPVCHTLSKSGFRTGDGIECGDDRDGVCAGFPTERRVFEHDASDGDERLYCEGTDEAKPVDADGRIGTIFGCGSEDRPEGEVIDGFMLSGPHLTGIVG